MWKCFVIAALALATLLAGAVWFGSDENSDILTDVLDWYSQRELDRHAQHRESFQSLPFIGRFLAQ